MEGTSPGRADRAPEDARPVSVLLGRGNSPATFLRPAVRGGLCHEHKLGPPAAGGRGDTGPGQAWGRQQLPVATWGANGGTVWHPAGHITTAMGWAWAVFRGRKLHSAGGGLQGMVEALGGKREQSQAVSA